MIAPNLVLTAAHCAVGTLASSWSVSTYRRDSRLYASEENAIEYSVTKIYIHPSYSDVTNDNDVAIFVLSAPTNYGTFKPTWISLNRNAALPAVGANTRVIGWGDLAYQGTSATYLMQVDIPIVASATCQSLTGDTITARMVCAGVTGKDSCQGDSGGPLMLLQGSTWLQIGIVSFGNGCGTQPGVYARVSALSSWIDGIIKVHYPAVLPASATATKTKTKTKSRTKTKTKTTTRMCRSTLLMPCKRRFEARDGDFLESGDLVQPEQATVTVREFVTVKETVTVFKRA